MSAGNKPDFEKIFVQMVAAGWLQQNNTTLDVLRLDLLHPVISGNKWFKLKYYLQNAVQQGFCRIGTFGGAYSNHIAATAYACKQKGVSSIGIIRGEKPEVLSHTLEQAEACGMELHFVSRALYNEPEKLKTNFKDIFWINEGGYGADGAKGASEILSYAGNPEKYSHIVCAVGTGTTLAGIVHSATVQEIIGISVMKGNFSMEEKVNTLLLKEDKRKLFRIVHDFHFGGYAKHPKELIDFMIQTWQQHQLPTDFVYTAKVFYAVKELITDHTIPAGSAVLMVHCGGLQGNGSLPPATLPF